MRDQAAWLKQKPEPALQRPAPLLQRTCACGGTPGPDGECAACKAKRLGLQPKLAIGAPGDRYEREADRIAEAVVGAAPGGTPSGVGQASRLQRSVEGGSAASEAPASVHAALGEAGRPLDQSARAFMEPRFGHNFSHVRVHTDARAAASARDVGALAYTVGRDLVFGAGQYAPATAAGRRLLAHELAHVLQQDGATEALQRFSTADCEDADVSRIEESHNRAIAIVEAAIARLTADPVTAETQRHFRNHFGGYGTWRRDIVVGHYRRDLALLQASEMTYQCESDCEADGPPAYTYWVFGDIHICLPWLRSQVLTERGETFIHELHHWDPGRGHLDLGYHRNNQDNDTTWIVAVNNSDAYSELAQDLYEQP